MYLCPQDLAWCTRAECRSGRCDMTGEPPFVACIGCGSLTERRITIGLCSDCVAAELRFDAEGT